MTAIPDAPADGETTVTVRLWAAAKAAAGTGEVVLEAADGLWLSELVERVLTGRPERLGPVLGGCSVLVGDRPVTTADPARVRVAPGETVEFLPPFAGG